MRAKDRFFTRERFNVRPVFIIGLTLAFLVVFVERCELLWTGVMVGYLTFMIPDYFVQKQRDKIHAQVMKDLMTLGQMMKLDRFKMLQLIDKSHFN